MGFYGDLLVIYGDLMEFYGDWIGFYGDLIGWYYGLIWVHRDDHGIILGYRWIYTLWLCQQLAIENGPVEIVPGKFSHEKLWFSIVMLNYQRVSRDIYRCCIV